MLDSGVLTCILLVFSSVSACSFSTQLLVVVKLVAVLTLLTMLFFFRLDVVVIVVREFVVALSANGVGGKLTCFGSFQLNFTGRGKQAQLFTTKLFFYSLKFYQKFLILS